MKRIIPSYKNLADVLQDAVDKERDAAQYYREAADLALEPEVKEFLRELAEMESQHFKMLKSRLETLQANGRIMTGILSSFGEEEKP